MEWTHPMYHTAAGLRSHLKNFVMEVYKINFGDPMVFPKWADWWKAYKGEVLKPNGKMKVCTSMFSICSSAGLSGWTLGCFRMAQV